MSSSGGALGPATPGGPRHPPAPSHFFSDSVQPPQRIRSLSQPSNCARVQGAVVGSSPGPGDDFEGLCQRERLSKGEPVTACGDGDSAARPVT